MRSSVVLLTLVLALVAGCGFDGGKYARVVVRGAEADRFVGRWYELDGRLVITVSQDGDARVARVLTGPPSYRPTAIEAVPEGLRVSIEGPEQTRRLLLRRIEWDDPEDAPARDCLMAPHWIVCRDLSLAARARGRTGRALRRAWRASEDAIDWLVRVL